MRKKFGEAGFDKGGFWIDDKHTGTKARIGNVSAEMAQEFYRQGNAMLAREVMKKPHFGFIFTKEF